MCTNLGKRVRVGDDELMPLKIILSVYKLDIVLQSTYVQVWSLFLTNSGKHDIIRLMLSSQVYLYSPK